MHQAAAVHCSDGAHGMLAGGCLPLEDVHHEQAAAGMPRHEAGRTVGCLLTVSSATSWGMDVLSHLEDLMSL